MTQGELGAAMDVDPSILVTLLNPLDAEDFLSRERDPADRRRHVVTLTPAGEQRLLSSALAQREAEDELFAVLTDVQRSQLREALLALRDGLAVDRRDGCAP